VTDEVQHKPALGSARLFALMLLCASLSPLTLNVFIPSIPRIVDELTAPYHQVQLGYSLYLVAAAAMLLLCGPASDIYGRRPILLAALCVFCLGTLLCASTSEVEWLLAGRVMQAASACGIGLSRATMRDVFESVGAARGISAVAGAMAIAPLFGSFIGGAVDDHFGWRASFSMIGLLGGLLLLAVALALPETRPPLGSASRGDEYRLLFRSLSYWKFVALSSLSAGIYFAFMGGAPLLADRMLDISAAEYGAWMMLFAVGYLAGSFGCGWAARDVTLNTLLAIGTLATILGSVALLAAALMQSLTALTLFLPTLLFGVGSGITTPSAAVGAIEIRPKSAGAASGVLAAMQMAIGAPVSMLGAFIVGTGEANGAILLGEAMLAMAVIALAIALLTRRQGRRGP